MKRGVKHGRWIGVKDGRVTEIEHWHEGVLHGPFRRWRYQGSYMDGTYHNSIHEEEDPPGECPVIFGQGARHRDPDDLDFR